MKFWLVRVVSVVAAVFLCYAVGNWAQASMTGYGYSLVVLAGLYVTLAVSLNLINGVTGQFSIGHAGFFMVGAYFSAFLTKNYHGQSHVPSETWVVLMAVFGAVAAGVTGLIVGLPSLRLRGDYLAIVTLGFGEIIRIVVQNLPILGGAYGLEAKLVPAVAAAPLVWLLAVFCVAVCRNLLRTVHGLPFLAVREDEVASAAMGVDVTMVKVTAFVVGSMFAGAAGGLFAPFVGFITPDNFKMDQSFIVLTMVVLGGTGSITGSVFAAILLFGLPEWLRLLKDPATGGTLLIPASGVVGAMLAVGLMLWGLRSVMNRYHGTASVRTALNVGVLVGAVLATFLLGKVLHAVPELAKKTYDMNQLRMAIFATTLIALMLLRPQGIFGHHEFSWQWLAQRLGFGRRRAVA